MNWHDKAEEIAQKIAQSASKASGGTITRPELIKRLQEAAIEGMKHECDCWMNKSK